MQVICNIYQRLGVLRPPTPSTSSAVVEANSLSARDPFAYVDDKRPQHTIRVGLTPFLWTTASVNATAARHLVVL